MSYPEVAKGTNLHGLGWATDVAYTDSKGQKTTNASVDNYGFMKRHQWYCEGFSHGAPYRSSGYTFYAPFRHELNGVTTPIVPGTSIRFELDRASSEFSLMKALHPDAAKPDANNYKLILLNASLFVKIGQMALPLYRELNEKHKKEAIRYYYRKLDIKVETVNTQSRLWQTNNLFPEGVQPIKVFFLFVNSDAYKGNLALNPYCFLRKWIVKEGSGFVSDDYVKGLEQKRNETIQKELLSKFTEYENRQTAKQKKQEALLRKQTFMIQKLFQSTMLGQKKQKGKSIPGKSVAKSTSVLPQMDGGPNQTDSESEHSLWMPDDDEEQLLKDGLIG